METHPTAKNKIFIHDDFAKVELYDKYGIVSGYAIIDIEDIPLVSGLRWYLINTRGYVSGYVDGKPLALHRFLLDTPKGLVTDHINHDKLDNRRSNLRICTQSQNLQNQRKQKHCSSKYKGVTFSKHANKWHVTIKHKYKLNHIGYYTSERNAAAAYNKAAKMYFGEYAYLNKLGD